MFTRLLILSFFIISNLLIAGTGFAEKIQIDTTKSHLTWLGKKLGEDHGGTISLKSGFIEVEDCLLYTSPSPRDATLSRMPSSA